MNKLKSIPLVVLVSIFFLLANLAFGADGKIPPRWPSSISRPSGFGELGERIKQEPNFPKRGTEIEKARYVYSRLPDIVSAYKLKPGEGRFDGALIGLDRLYRKIPFVNKDPEAADSLKGWPRRGYCGEWSHAFAEILRGAGSGGYVAYGDKVRAKLPITTPTYSGTSTMVIVEERVRDGKTSKTSRRVFDPYSAVSRSPPGTVKPEKMKDWGDLPLTDEDELQRDIDAERNSWKAKTKMPIIRYGDPHLAFNTGDEIPPVLLRHRPSPKPEGSLDKMRKMVDDYNQIKKFINNVEYRDRALGETIAGPRGVSLESQVASGQTAASDIGLVQQQAIEKIRQERQDLVDLQNRMQNLINRYNNRRGRVGRDWSESWDRARQDWQRIIGVMSKPRPSSNTGSTGWRSGSQSADHAHDSQGRDIGAGRGNLGPAYDDRGSRPVYPERPWVDDLMGDIYGQ